MLTCKLQNRINIIPILTDKLIDRYLGFLHIVYTYLKSLLFILPRANQAASFTLEGAGSFYWILTMNEETPRLGVSDHNKQVRNLFLPCTLYKWTNQYSIAVIWTRNAHHSPLWLNTWLPDDGAIWGGGGPFGRWAGLEGGCHCGIETWTV